MISLKCPYCNVGLKVDESKLPDGITAFKCPKCKQSIPVSLLSQPYTSHQYPINTETSLVHPVNTGLGKLVVLAGRLNEEQVFQLREGISVIGRNTAASKADIRIITADKSMSREHIRIDVKKNAKGGYKHYLSDNNSKNHTLYNSNYLKEGEVVILRDNDEIILGSSVLRFNE